MRFIRGRHVFAFWASWCMADNMSLLFGLAGVWLIPFQVAGNSGFGL